MNYSLGSYVISEQLLLTTAEISSEGGTATSTSPEGLRDVMQDPSLTKRILYFVQVLTLGTVTTVGMTANAMVFFLFYRRPALRSSSNRFVLNLSACHVLHCLLVQMPTDVAFESGGLGLGDDACVGIGVTSTALNIASVLSLLLIALDRNCAVNSPLHYSMTITKKRTGALICGLWTVSSMVAVPPLFGVAAVEFRPMWHACTVKWIPGDIYSIAYDTVLFILGFVVPFLITSFVYSSMFQAARDNTERARKHSLNSTVGEVTIPEGPVKPPPTGAARKKFRRWSSGSSQNSLFGDEWKAIRTGLLVVLTFVLCWFPYFATFFTESFLPLQEIVSHHAMFFVILCSFSSSVINPYLYVYRNKASRKHIKKLLGCFFPGRRQWTFRRKPNHREKHANPCILSANLVNKTSEKVEALPVLFQDGDGRWQVFGNSPSDRRDELLDGAATDVSEDCMDEPGTEKGILRRKSSGNINVQAIYNNSFARSCLQRNISSNSLSMQSNKVLLFRLKAHLNQESTSSDTTENFSMSFDSSNASESQDKTRQNSQNDRQHSFTKSLRAASECRETLHRVSSLSEGLSSLENIKENMACVSHALSYIGTVRRKSFIRSRMKNRRSSDTASSTNSETIDSNSSTPTRERKEDKAYRPKLIRQDEMCLSTKTESSVSTEGQADETA